MNRLEGISYGQHSKKSGASDKERVVMKAWTCSIFGDHTGRRCQESRYDRANVDLTLIPLSLGHQWPRNMIKWSRNMINEPKGIHGSVQKLQMTPLPGSILT